MAVLAGDGLLCRPLLASVDEALEKYGESLVRQCGALPAVRQSPPIAAWHYSIAAFVCS